MLHCELVVGESMTAELFLLFVALTSATILTVLLKYLSIRQALPLAGIFLAWLGYVGYLSWHGVVRNPALRPPGIVFIVAPLLIYVFAWVVRSRTALTLAMAAPGWLLLGLQSFRVVVELFLHRLWVEGLVPKMLTYRGANVDILIGMSAPFVAWISTQGRVGRRIALGWNWLGLAALANVVIRSILTSPGPLRLLHTSVANTAIGRFPFTFMAGLFVPCALTLHILSIRFLRSSSSFIA